MADANTSLDLEPEADLFRAPVLTQQCFDQLPGFFLDPWLRLVVPPIYCKLMRLFRPITTQALVSADLSTYRGFRHTDDIGYLELDMSCFHQCLNLVSLFLGKLCVAAHRCSTFLAVREMAACPFTVRPSCTYMLNSRLIIENIP